MMEDQEFLLEKKKKEKSGGCDAKLVSFVIIGGVTFFYVIAELAAAIYLNSLVLLSDGFHNLSDVVSLYIAFWARQAAKRKSSDEMSYGWARTELLGGLTNGCFLLALVLYVILESIPKFIKPVPIESGLLFIIISGSGLAINTIGTIVFSLTGMEHGHSHSHGGGHGHSHGHSHGDKEKKKDKKKNQDQMELHTPMEVRIVRASQKLDDSDNLMNGNGEKKEKKEKKEGGGHGHSHGHGHDHGHDDHEHNHGDEHEHKHEEKKEKKEKHGHAHGHEHKEKKEKHGHAHGHEHKEKKEKEGHSHGHGGHSHNDEKQKPKKKRDENTYAIFLHFLGDAISSLMVLTAGLLLHFFDGARHKWTDYIDPATSLIVCVLILYTTIPLVKRCSMILLQGAGDVKISAIRSKLLGIEGLLSLHDLHVWQLVDGMSVASIHVAVEEGVDFNLVVSEIKRAFHKYGVHSTTIQPEFVPRNHSTTPYCVQNCVKECEEDWCCKKSAETTKDLAREFSIHTAV